jgi:acyl carrier protein
LQRALAHDVPHCTAASVDWNRFREVYEARRSRAFVSLLGESALDDDRPRVESSVFLRELSGQKLEDRLVNCRRLVAANLCQILRIGAEADLDVTRPFKELGLDSLMAVELRNSISRACQLRLPVSTVFDFPSVNELSEHILSQLSADLEPANARNVGRQANNGTNGGTKLITALGEEDLLLFYDRMMSELEGN